MIRQIGAGWNPARGQDAVQVHSKQPLQMLPGLLTHPRFVATGTTTP